MVDLSSLRAGPEFQPDLVTRRVDRNAALRNPSLVPLEAADHFPLDEVVFGVELGDDRRCYPASLLKKFMVINDRSADQPFVVAFCGRCMSGSGFERTVGNQVLTFRVYGGYQGTMVMRDDQTATLWSPVTGEALAGPLAGRRLTIVQVETSTLAAWAARHPGSLTPEEAQWVPPWHPSAGPLREWQRRTTAHWDDRLEPRTWVLGLTVDGHARAYQVDPAYPGPPLVQDEIGGKPIVLLASPGSWPRAFERATAHGVLNFRMDGDRIKDQTGSTWENGRAVRGPLADTVLHPVPSNLTQWHAWAAYHPGTQLGIRLQDAASEAPEPPT